MADLSVPSRSRAAWWAYVGALGAMAAFVGYRLVGTFVFGVFLYYGTRPVYERVQRVVRAPGVAAAVTLLLTALPGLAVLGYLVLEGLSELTPELRSYQTLLAPYVDVAALTSHPVQTLLQFVENPSASRLQTLLGTWARYLGFAAGVVETVFVAVLFAFYLLRDGDRLAHWFRENVGGEGTAAYGYVTAVDRDLETIYFSNVLLVFFVALVAAVVYNGYNFVTPVAVNIPYPTAFAILTGIASLVPLVVGKLVYVPLTLYVGARAVRADPSLVAYPAGLLVVSFVVLDLVPLTFVLPELAGRDTHVGLIMFAYVVGTILFGWYGLFLGPLLVVLAVQAVRIVLTELLHGRPVTPRVRAADDIGSEPED